MDRLNRIKKIALFLLLISLFSCLVACADKKPNDKEINVLPDPSEGKTITFTVAYDSHGGSAVSSATVEPYSLLRKPSDPTRDGYVFGGWYISEELFTQWDFDKDLVSASMTLHAKWTLETIVSVKSAAGKRAFSVESADAFSYRVAVDAETLDLTSDLVFRDVNCRYRFYYDEDCQDPACDPDCASFTLHGGANVYYLDVMNSALKRIKLVRFTVYKNRICTVSFFAGDAEIGSVEVEEGNVVPQPVEYALIGYDVRWYDGDTLWKFGAGGTVVTGDVRLISSLEVKRYVLTLDPSGGTIDKTQQTVYYGEITTITPPRKSNAGFLGWYNEYGLQVTDASGLMLRGWYDDGDATLTALWEGNAQSVSVTRKEGNEEKEIVTHNTVSGGTVVLRTHPYEVVFTGGAYRVYAFAGWYDGAARLSMERTYTISDVSASKQVTEQWYVLSFGIDHVAGDTPDAGAVESGDLYVEFSGNDKLTTYGNINVGETIAATAKCLCGRHTFLGWSTGERATRIVTRAADGNADVLSSWKSCLITVTHRLKDAVTTDATFTSAVRAPAFARKDDDVTVSVDLLDGYTFCGWEYEDDGGDSVTSYETTVSFTMKEEKDLVAKWYPTQEYFFADVTLSGADVDGHFGGALITVDREENRVGGTFALNPYAAYRAGQEPLMLKDKTNISDGVSPETYSFTDKLFVGLKIAGETVVCDENALLSMTFPEEPLSCACVFMYNDLRFAANRENAGELTYSVRGETAVGSRYGEEIVLPGMITGDDLVVRAASYDGYTWLGWWKNGEFVTEETSVSFSSVTAVLAAIGGDYVACWKPNAYTVNVVPGVYATATPSYITAGGFYTYSTTTGVYTLAEKGMPDAGTTYYTYASGATTGGTQSVTSVSSDDCPGETVTLHAAVRYGYRFEGWFDADNTCLTFDRDYSFHVKDMKTEYRAQYAYLTNYKVTAQAFESEDEGISAQGIGTVGLFAYKRLENGACKEYCRIEAITTEGDILYNVSTGASVMQGYNYIGLFRYNVGTPTSAVLRSGDPEASENGFDPDIFGYSYVVDVSELRRINATTQKYYALWDTDGYYQASNSVYNDDPDSGTLKYMAYNGELILVARPLTGSYFNGWTNGETVLDGNPVYKPDSESGETFYATWKTINAGARKQLAFVGATTREEGGYSVYGYRSGSMDVIRVESTTNDGYVFLGWYVDGKVLSFEETLDVRRTTEEGEEILRLHEHGESYELMSYAIEPRWRRSDAHVVVESIGKTVLTGYVKNSVYNDATGEYDEELVFRLRTETPIEYPQYDAGWYGGYYFEGWFTEGFVLITTDYVLELTCDELQSYAEDGKTPRFYAIWTMPELRVEITQNVEESTGCTTTYSFYRLGDETHLVLYAQVGDGYMFNGWVRISNQMTESRQAYYDRVLSPGVTELAYAVTFTEIDAMCKPTASTDTGMLLGAPKIHGYGTKFVVTATPKTGYVFLGWKTDVNAVAFLSRDAEYEYDYQKPSGELADPVVGVYTEWRSTAEYYDLYVTVVPEQFEAFRKYVDYYGYDSGTTSTLVIVVDVPDGYAFVLTVFEDGKTVPLATQGDRYVTDQPKNGTYSIRFLSVSETLDAYVDSVEWVNNVSYRRTGDFEKTASVRDDAVYIERRTLTSRFAEDGYAFIGWYDKDGTLIDIEATTVRTAPADDYAVSVAFGAYSVELENTNETAGLIYVNDYDVTVSFDRNSDDPTLVRNFATPDPQKINAGQQLEYPLTYVNKNTAGYMFGGWYTTPECNDEDRYSFDGVVKWDMTLYAKWIAMSDYGATSDERLKFTGEERVLTATTAGSLYYFTALTDTNYYLYAENTVERTAAVSYGKAKLGGGIEEIVGTMTTEGLQTFGAAFRVQAGVTYAIRLFCATKEDEQTVLFRLVGETPVSTAIRDNKVPYGGSIVVTAEPYGNVAGKMSESDFILTTATGYVFAGWEYYKNDAWRLIKEGDAHVFSENQRFTVHDPVITITQEQYATFADSDGVLRLRAKWDEYSLEIILSDRDGGSVGGIMTTDLTDQESVYYGAHAWQLSAMLRYSQGVSAYNFAGWYLYDWTTETFENNPVSENALDNLYVYDGDYAVRLQCRFEYKTETGKYSISYSLGDGVNSPLNVSAFNKDNSTRIRLYDPHRYYRDDEDNVLGYYVFEGWYREKTFETKVEEIDPSAENQNVTLYAKWGEAVKGIEILTDEYGVQYFYMGVYPQTLVTRSTGDGITIDNTQYDADDYRSRYNYYYMHDPETRLMSISETLYVECNPIRWNVLRNDDGVLYAQSELVLNVKQYAMTTAKIDEIYADNWEHSDLREWIASDFYSYAFSFTEKNLLRMSKRVVKNDSASGNPAYNDYAWAKQNDTDDVVYVASYYDRSNLDDPLPVTYSEYARYLSATATGYWLRTWGRSGSTVYYVAADGSMLQRTVTDVSGVRPVITVDSRY